MSDEIIRALGRIEGRLDGLEKGQLRVEGKVDKLDERLQAVERSASIYGGASGGVMAVGVALLQAGIAKLTGGGGL